MNWQSLSAFWAMGGYALYVWGSVLVVLAALVLECLALMSARRSALRWAHQRTSRREQLVQGDQP
jgi:heme exporter protein D